jgi:phospholipid/cholesterol/gamma-HCH transport system ATP-binding protein
LSNKVADGISEPAVPPQNSSLPDPRSLLVPDHNVVNLTNVAFGYDRSRNVLENISLTVPQGKIVALMGRSGSGKTTILRLIGGVYRATAGRVEVFGQDVGALDTRALYRLREKMGMLFQFGALFTDLSVFDNVAFPLRERTHLPERLIRDLVLMKLEAVGLRGAQSLMPFELSGGMARRIALARGIALDPRLMMFDEPFTGLDPISLGTIGKLVRELNDALGATSIIVTHDVQESMLIVDYLYFVSDGRVVASGTPEEIRASENAFVRQFVRGETEGAVPFHYPAANYRDELLGTVAA